MPLLFHQQINEVTRIAVWKIVEPEAFFAKTVKLQNEISHTTKRLQHLAGRYLLKILYADFPLESIKFCPFKKPYLENQEYEFSISHCGNFAAAIVSKFGRVGIDIEFQAEKLLRLKEKFLNEEEVQSLNRNFSLKKLTLLWSTKEAMFKWWGLGGVDFKNDLLIRDFELKTEGSGNALFKKNDFEESLVFQYMVFELLCLVWVCTGQNT